jgi:hypothetical protein
MDPVRIDTPCFYHEVQYHPPIYTWIFQMFSLLFSSILSLHPSYVQIFSSAPCSRVPSKWVLHLTFRDQFHISTRHVKIMPHCLQDSDLSTVRSWPTIFFSLTSIIHNLYWTDAFRSVADHHQCPTLMHVPVITVLHWSGICVFFTYAKCPVKITKLKCTPVYPEH